MKKLLLCLTLCFCLTARAATFSTSVDTKLLSADPQLTQMAAAATLTLGVLDKTFDFPAPTATVEVRPAEFENPGTQGAYSPSGGHLYISITADHPEEVLAHELGHYIDFRVIGPALHEKDNAACDHDGDLKAWWTAANNSQRCRDWATLGKLFADCPGNDFAGYVLRPEEMWARSFDQYVARKSANETLGRDISAVQHDWRWAMWDDRDFDPIYTAMDGFFGSHKWLR